MSISEALNNVQNSFFDSHPHRQASLASVQHALGQTQKLFSTAMAMLRAIEWKHEDHEDVMVEPVRQYQPTEFDINIHVALAENTIRVQFDTWRSRISQRNSESILATYLHAVQDIVSVRVGGIISEIDIVSTDDKTLIHHIAQRTMQPALESTLHNLVVQQSRRKPEAEAIHAWDGSFTYQQIEYL
jgi:non-ribosomal peptide synthetase component F